MDQEELATLQTAETLLQSREMFFNQEVDVQRSLIGCVDERTSDQDGYIHLPGGAAYFAFNWAVMREAEQPGSTKEATFTSDVATATTALKNKGMIPAVHSTVEAEGGTTINKNAEHDIECGYIKARRPITNFTVENRNDILALIDEKEPELLQGSDLRAWAGQVFDAMERMTHVEPYWSPSREVARAAMDAGAKTMTVEGDHNGHDGIRNKQKDTSMSNNLAQQAGMPTYDSDDWAATEINRELANHHGFDTDKLAIVGAIDTYATLLFLHVTSFDVRK